LSTNYFYGCDGVSVGPHNELKNYFVELESLSEDSALQYWL